MKKNDSNKDYDLCFSNVRLTSANIIRYKNKLQK